MKKEKSGKIYRFQLDHNFGYGFAEIYDFTDFCEFDGRIVYVYNRIDKEIQTKYDLEKINASGIALGPIRLANFPSTRGKYATKLIGQRTSFLINEIPPSKELQSLIINHLNWNDFNQWYRSDTDKTGDSKFTDYKNVRNLENRVLNHIASVATKFTMKKIIDEGMELLDYYDLTDVGKLNLCLQLINTYYPLETTEKLIAGFKKTNANIGYTK